MTDIYAAAEAAAKLWGMSGMGPLGIRGDFEKIGELMGWVDWPPEDEIEKAPEKSPEEEKQSQQEEQQRKDEEQQRQEDAVAAGLNTVFKKIVEGVDQKIEDALEEL